MYWKLQCCIFWYSFIFRQTITQKNQPGSHCFTCTGGCAGKAALAKVENYNCDAPLADADFGKRAGAFINLSITPSQSQLEVTKVASKLRLQSSYFLDVFQRTSFIHCLPIWPFLIVGRKALWTLITCKLKSHWKAFFQENVIVVRTFRECWSFKVSHDVLHFSSKWTGKNSSGSHLNSQ